MDDQSVSTPHLAESDAENNTISTPNAAPVTNADKVINTKIDNSQTEADQGEEELLKGLLTDDYCHVCDAVLLFESQRLSHYEGKKHTLKLKLYLQAKRAEKMNKESSRFQGNFHRGMTVDKDRFCELCSMVFSSPVVARSHYEGKVHAKNLRKQGHQPTDISSPKGADVPTLPSLTQASTIADHKFTREGIIESQDPTATTSPSTEVDLKDSNKYCALCAASFNNPQMALQHYNGKKHQRNQARQELLKGLGEHAQQANSLLCQMCNVQFNSVEMYQAHMQGNKHQIKEKKVVDLCNSQQKVYSTFADELADYIQVQKARGITPKNTNALPQGDEQKDWEEDEEEGTNKGGSVQLNNPRPNLPPTFNPPHHPLAGSYYPAAGWWPPNPGLPANSLRGTSCHWDYSVPPVPVLPATGSTQFASWSMTRKRHREQSSSSSSYITSSSSPSSYTSSSSTSDSDYSKYRHKEGKRKIKRSRKERGRRAQEVGSEKDERRRRKRQRRSRDDEERRREEDAESEERRRKRQKNHGKGRRQEKKTPEEDCEEEGGERVAKELNPEDVVEKREGTEVHMQAEITVEEGEREQAKPSKPKHRKEKKKMKEKVDTRTEEEKLWDESILGL